MRVDEEELEQAARKVVPVMAKHFWPIYLGTLFLAIMASYHNVITILPHPVMANGVTTVLRETYRANFFSTRGSFTERLYARKINFNWQNRGYEIIGGWDEEMETAVPVKVVFNAGHPEKGMEFSIGGLLDFRVLRWALPLWICISGFIYAFSYFDSHFTAFNFKVPKLTALSFIYMLVIVLFIPLYPITDLLLFGKTADGVMGDEADCVNGYYLRPIVFKAAGNQYVAYSAYANEYEKLTGRHFKIRYRPDNPNRYCLYQAGAFYANNYTILMGILLIFLTGWFYSSVVLVIPAPKGW